MPGPSVEERLAHLEGEVDEIKRLLVAEPPSSRAPWWEERFGAFADSPEYEEASRLGRKYRKAQTPETDTA